MDCECKQSAKHGGMEYKLAVKTADIMRKIQNEYEKRLAVKQKEYPALHCDGTIIDALMKEMKLEKKLTKKELVALFEQAMWSYVNAKDSAKFYRDQNYENKDFINFLLYAIKHNIKVVWDK